MTSNQAILIVVLIASICNLTIGLATFSRNPKGLINRLFFLNTLALVGWSVANYFVETLTNPSHLFLSQMLIFSFVVLQNSIFFILARFLSGDRLSRLVKFVYIPFTAIVLLLPLAGPLFSSYMVENGHYSLHPGPGMLTIPLHALVTVVWGFGYFVRRFKQLQGQQRNQFRYLVLAGAVIWAIVPLSQAIIPRIFGEISADAIVGGWRLLIASAPLYALAFASIIAFAIVRQRLFDIRPVVARGMSFLLLTSVLAVTYLATSNFVLHR